MMVTTVHLIKKKKRNAAKQKIKVEKNFIGCLKVEPATSAYGHAMLHSLINQNDCPVLS